MYIYIYKILFLQYIVDIWRITGHVNAREIYMFIKFEEIEHEGRVGFVIDLHY